VAKTTAPAAPAEDMVDVVLPSGVAWPVHGTEVDYFTDRATRYLTDNHFANVSDFQDLDRVLMMELLCFRWSTWISNQVDYWDEPVDLDALQRAFKEHSVELRQLKKQLGIDKAARDRTKGEDSTPVFIANLLARAKEFGVMREEQLSKALSLFNELKALVTLHLNADETERAEMHIAVEDILDWLTTTAFPEFDAIDEHFRKNVQRTWIRDQ
jgi:hypothetical protein